MGSFIITATQISFKFLLISLSGRTRVLSRTYKCAYDWGEVISIACRWWRSPLPDSCYYINIYRQIQHIFLISFIVVRIGLTQLMRVHGRLIEFVMCCKGQVKILSETVSWKNIVFIIWFCLVPISKVYNCLRKSTLVFIGWNELASNNEN